MREFVADRRHVMLLEYWNLSHDGVGMKMAKAATVYRMSL